MDGTALEHHHAAVNGPRQHRLPARVGRRLLAALGAALGLLSGACVADDTLVRVELGFEAPGERIAQVAIDWASGTVTGQVRTRVPGCDQAWNAACWTRRTLQGHLDKQQQARLLQLLAPVPLGRTPPLAAPGASHYALAMVRQRSVAHGVARPGEGAAADAIAQALALAGAGP